MQNKKAMIGFITFCYFLSFQKVSNFLLYNDLKMRENGITTFNINQLK